MEKKRLKNKEKFEIRECILDEFRKRVDHLERPKPKPYPYPEPYLDPKEPIKNTDRVFESLVQSLGFKFDPDYEQTTADDYNLWLLEKTEELFDNSWEKNEHYPTEWMKDEPVIKKYQICEVLNEVERKEKGQWVSLRTMEGVTHTIPEHVIKEHKVKGKTVKAHVVKGMKYPILFFVTNSQFYKTILPNLNMKQDALQRYFPELARRDALTHLDIMPAGTIRKSQKCYGVGYEMAYPGGKTFKRFLTAEKMAQLRKFKL